MADIHKLNKDRIDGADAMQLLDNPIFNRAIARVEEHIDQKMVGADPDNTKLAQRLILSKQILKSLVKEVAKVAENGEIAKIRIKEIEDADSLKNRVFRR